MLTKILIDRNISLDWELEEKLLKLCNGFEVDNKELVLWAHDDKEDIINILNDAKISYLTIETEQPNNNNS
jgi:hypothetical protein